MKHHVLLSALLVLFCAFVSVAQEKAARGEYVAKDLPCDMVFVKRVQTRSEVLYNTRFTAGGNLIVLRRDRTLHNLTRLKAGDVSDPDVSYDGKRILFSMMKDKTDRWHVYEIRPDGTGLRQLTSGDHDNVDPCYLPNGKICFCSNRTGILNEYEMQRAELLHVMDADGSNVRQISFFLSGDYNPMVLHDGRLLWMRYEHHGEMDFFPESDTAATLLEKARRFRFQGKIDEAEIACRQALVLQPRGTLERRVRLELGVLFTQYGTPALTDEMRASRPRRELQQWVVSYDLETGQERWRIEGGGDNPVPTPFAIDERIYISNAHGGQAPIIVVRSNASGNLSEDTHAAEKGLVWRVNRGGCYMSTPLVYGDYLYLGNTNGVLRCIRAGTGEMVYEERLGSGASVVASLVAADNKIYCPSEDGTIYVLKPGPEFEILAKNQMGEPCFATPAISEGTLFVRTTETLYAIRPSE